MIHIRSITDIRQNLPQLIKKLIEPVVIVQNSKPTAVLISYEDFLKWQDDEEQRQFMEMVKSSTSFEDDDEDKKLNYDPKDLKPFKAYAHISL